MQQQQKYQKIKSSAITVQSYIRGWKVSFLSLQLSLLEEVRSWSENTFQVHWASCFSPLLGAVAVPQLLLNTRSRGEFRISACAAWAKNPCKLCKWNAGATLNPWVILEASSAREFRGQQLHRRVLWGSATELIWNKQIVAVSLCLTGFSSYQDSYRMNLTENRIKMKTLGCLGNLLLGLNLSSALSGKQRRESALMFRK